MSVKKKNKEKVRSRKEMPSKKKELNNKKKRKGTSLKDRYQQDYASKDAGGSSSGKNILNLLKYPSTKFFKIEKGWNEVDIIPYTVSSDKHPQKVSKGELDYKLDIWIHRFVGAAESNYVCLKKNYGRACPICEDLQKMIDSGEFEEKAINQLKPKRRVIYNIIDLNDQDAGIKLLESSHFEFQKEIIEEAETGSDSGEFLCFADLEGGYTVKFRGSEREGDFKGSLKPKSFKLESREDYPESILDDTLPLDSLLVIPSYEEMKESYFGLNEEFEDDDSDEDEDTDDNDSDDDDEEEEKSKKTPRKRKRKDEEEEDSDDEPEEEEEDSDDEEETDDDEEETDDDEEEEEEPVKTKKGKSSNKKEDKSTKKNKCPHGGKFGKDCDELDECEDCKLWDECSEV